MKIRTLHEDDAKNNKAEKNANDFEAAYKKYVKYSKNPLDMYDNANTTEERGAAVAIAIGQALDDENAAKRYYSQLGPDFLIRFVRAIDWAELRNKKNLFIKLLNEFDPDSDLLKRDNFQTLYNGYYHKKYTDKDVEHKSLDDIIKICNSKPDKNISKSNIDDLINDVDGEDTARELVKALIKKFNIKIENINNETRN